MKRMRGLLVALLCIAPVLQPLRVLGNDSLVKPTAEERAAINRGLRASDTGDLNQLRDILSRVPLASLSNWLTNADLELVRTRADKEKRRHARDVMGEIWYGIMRNHSKEQLAISGYKPPRWPDYPTAEELEQSRRLELTDKAVTAAIDRYNALHGESRLTKLGGGQMTAWIIHVGGRIPVPITNGEIQHEDVRRARKEAGYDQQIQIRKDSDPFSNP